MRKLNLKPLGETIIAKRKSAESTTPGGIVLPDVAKEKPKQAIVLAVGPKCKGVKPGNSVLFGAYAGRDFIHENEELLFLTEEDILAIVED